MNHAPGRYLRLDLFIKVLSLLCPNLTDASTSSLPGSLEAVVRLGTSGTDRPQTSDISHLLEQRTENQPNGQPWFSVSLSSQEG